MYRTRNKGYYQTSNIPYISRSTPGHLKSGFRGSVDMRLDHWTSVLLDLPDPGFSRVTQDWIAMSPILWLAETAEMCRLLAFHQRSFVDLGPPTLLSQTPPAWTYYPRRRASGCRLSSLELQLLMSYIHPYGVSIPVWTTLASV